MYSMSAACACQRLGWNILSVNGRTKVVAPDRQRLHCRLDWPGINVPVTAAWTQILDQYADCDDMYTSLSHGSRQQYGACRQDFITA
jgi:hypothetical protein